MVVVNEYKWVKAVLMTATARKHTRFNIKQSDIVKQLDDESKRESTKRVQDAVTEGKRLMRIREYGDGISISCAYLPTFFKNVGGKAKLATKDWMIYRKEMLKTKVAALETLKEIMEKCSYQEQEHVLKHLIKMKKLVDEVNEDK